MKLGWLFALVPGLLIFGAVIFVLSLLLVKVLWAWTVPDLFPGAVSQGLVASTISWLTALKLAIMIAVLGTLTGLRGHAK